MEFLVEEEISGEISEKSPEYLLEKSLWKYLM